MPDHEDFLDREDFFFFDKAFCDHISIMQDLGL